MTVPSWLGEEPGGKPLGPPPLKLRPMGARGGIYMSAALADPAKPTTSLGWRGGDPLGRTPDGMLVLSVGGGGCGAYKGAPARRCWTMGMWSCTPAQGARGDPQVGPAGGGGGARAEASLGTMATCHGAIPDPGPCSGRDSEPDRIQ